MQDKGRLENTTLLSDINSVAGATHTHSQWLYLSAVIHTKEEDIPVPKILVKQDVKQYAEDTSGYGIITLIMGRGDMFYRLYPYRDNLEISITTKYLFYSGKVDEKRTEVVRYKALYKDDVNPAVQMNNDANRTIEELNQQGHVELDFELQELFEEPYRIVTIDGAYNGQTTKDLLEAACTDRLNQIRIEGKPLLEAFHVEPPHNEKPYNSLIVRRGVMVKDFPGWLQEKGRGVYNSGIGNFIDRFKGKVTWFVYPLYDFKKRFDDDVEKMIIYFAPQDRFGGIENTFRREGKVTYVVTTSSPPVNSNAFNADLNRGSGFRMTSPEAILSKPADLTDGVVADFKRMNTEMVFRERPDQLNYGRIVGSHSNQYLQMSRILKNQVTFLNVGWDYADLSTIYPMMPCKCIFMNQGVYEEKYGAIQTAYGVTRVLGNPMTSDKFKLDMELRIAMEPVDYKPPVPKGGQYGDS